MNRLDDLTIPWVSAAAEVYETESEHETKRVAAAFAKRLQPGSWVGLMGPLGAGKSVFARAIGSARGVTGAMPSPSYTLLHTHEGDCAVHHMDLYRVETVDELDFAGLTPYFQGPGICLVEWAEKARSWWPERGWIVEIQIKDSDKRRIAIREFQISDKSVS